MKGVGLWVLGTRLGARNIQVDYDRLLPAAHNHGLDRMIGPCIELLVRHIRRHIDEVSGTGFINKFQTVSPAKPRAAANDIKHGLQFSMMVRACLGAGVDHHGSRPKFLCTDSSVRNGFSSRHPQGLRSVSVELSASDNSDAVVFPFRPLVQLRVGHRLRLLSLEAIAVGRNIALNHNAAQVHSSVMYFRPSSAVWV
jgi:hypothetical protein